MSVKSTQGSKIGQDAKYVGGLIKRVGNFRPGAYSKNIVERKQFQKTIYLMQAFGIKLGFNFTWYIQGPYNSTLADVGYEIAKHYEKIPELYFSEEKYSNIFDQYLSYMDGVKNDPETLEIAASLHFLWLRNEDMPRDVLIEWLQIEKNLESNFNDIVQIWTELEQEGLIEN